MYLEIIISVSTAFILERTWDFYKNKCQKKKTINETFREIKFNAQPGSGCPTCPFKLKAHNKLLSFKIPKELKELLEKIIQRGELCKGGNKYQTPGQIKTLEKTLKTKLNQL